KASELSADEKRLVSSLVTIAGGLAGAAGTGGDLSMAAPGANAAKVELENNTLGDGWHGLLSSGEQKTGQAVSSYVEYAQKNNLPPEQIQAGLENIIQGDLPESADVVKAILSNNPGSDTVMALLTAEEAKDYALALLTSLPAERALALVGKAANVIDNKLLISAAEKISTAKPGQQFTQPRDLNEQLLWSQVSENPASGQPLRNMNNDPRFPVSAGFQKMQVTQKTTDGQSITIHYQYNSNTGKAYDIKITTPQRITSDPSDIFNSIKDAVK
ncbi:VENN motif pre-toxin domain-containing protein, partial [Tenebrionicola larvae]|uniref:VENN motif pre-toxin domain-containing protein n=2 Tax=Tenebrionibacter/Tenebrionicola group TaxID=2969848 RepID=UPI00201F7CE5